MRVGLVTVQHVMSLSFGLGATLSLSFCLSLSVQLVTLPCSTIVQHVLELELQLESFLKLECYCAARAARCSGIDSRVVSSKLTVSREQAKQQVGADPHSCVHAELGPSKA